MQPSDGLESHCRQAAGAAGGRRRLDLWTDGHVSGGKRDGNLDTQIQHTATHQRPRQAIVAEHMFTRRQAGVRWLGGAADAARGGRIYAAAFYAGGANSRQHLPGLSGESLDIKCHRHGIGEANQTCGGDTDE